MTFIKITKNDPMKSLTAYSATKIIKLNYSTNPDAMGTQWESNLQVILC